jgi:PAS domain S-box-containing protein
MDSSSLSGRRWFDAPDPAAGDEEATRTKHVVRIAGFVWFLLAMVPASFAAAGSQLPAGTNVFDPQSLFEQYRGYAIAGLLLLALQLALIVGLLVQRAYRRRAEEEMRNSEQRYRSVVDTQSEMICRFLPDTTLTFVNDAYCRFWNKTHNELLGRKFIEIIPPASRQAVVDHLARTRDGISSHEHQVTMADGSIGWQHWINHPIVDERGDVLEYQGVGRDVTDRRRAEQVACQLEARNSAILRAIPDLMYVLLRDGTYVDFHARDPGLLLVAPDQLIGRTIRDVMPPTLADTLMEALERVCLSDEPVVVEFELALGEPRHFEARFVKAEQDCVLSIVRDVTEWKRSLALNRDLAGRLIASQEVERTRIARDIHDGVCQDVAAVSVDLSHLRRTGGDIQNPAAQETLLAVERRTAKVAESLRLLSHGLHPSVLQHIGLVPALQAQCAEVERQHAVQVTFFAEGDIEPASPMIALSLFRIAQEALRNAATHGHARNATVSLVRSYDTLTLAIADDGEGFDPVAARQQDGLGLVSIVERARLMRGFATIQSEPGGGTIVDVRVPLAGDRGHRRYSGSGRNLRGTKPPSGLPDE